MSVINQICLIVFGIFLITGIIMTHDMVNDSNQTQWSFAEKTEQNSPKKQTESGTALENIICKESHVLSIRVNNTPICTTTDTANALIERGVIDRIIGHTTSHEDENAKEISASETQKDHTNNKDKDKIKNKDINQSNNNQTVTNATTTNATTTNATTTNATTTNATTTNATTTNATTTNATTTNATTTNATTTNATTTNSTSTQKQQFNPSSVTTIPASTMSIVNFYVTDHDLNIAPNAPEIIPIEGLLKFSINGIPVDGPKTMIETGPNTGQFYVKLELPATINGKPLSQNDIVEVTYLDQTDYSGERQSIKKSFALSSTYAHMQSEGDGAKRIGHKFKLTIYEPDANKDSKEEDKIPLSRFEFKSDGNVRATLDHHAFDSNRSHMIETGPNTGMFDITIKIPRQIDGKIIGIGDWYEITYNDYSTPSGTLEEIVLKGKIGL